MAYLRTRLGRWFYEDEGEAIAAGDPAIVLLPSLLCDGGMWRGQRATLRALGRVVVFDPPGHGRSEVPPRFTLEEHARALVDALDALGIARAVLVGLSWGGMVSMCLALLAPDRVKAMAILDTSADEPPLREKVEYRVLCALARRIGLPPGLVRKRVVPLMFAPRTRATQPGLVDEFVRALGGYSREGVTRATAAVSIDRAPLLDRLRDITTPTLVGYGEDDTATPAPHARRIASRIAGSILVPFAGVGHLSALEDPALVNASLVPFVRDQVRPA